MKHARPDYNRIQDPDNKIPGDEPAFLLRGQDVSAADTVRAWANLNDLNGGSQRLSDAARQQADKMDAWPKKKPADGLSYEILSDTELSPEMVEKVALKPQP